ncbi:myosin heavy chain, clone 203-like [Branchiostoma lanceolatum]|uniref:myosin heavy chain, clone 203-like n=1 Tax=Branchiostoma lanceolatum TaxID=7740 RepID=UPI003454A48A
MASTKPKPTAKTGTKDGRSSRGTQKRNLRLCEVVKKGDKTVPKYKDIHLNVKEKKNANKEALEVTSMQCEELKEANMYLTKILGVEKNARTIQLIDQLQRHQKTLEAELEEARRKETHAQERAEKAERHANEISQQVEQVRRSRDKTVSEKEQLLQDVEKERKAFEKVRQHVESVGKMRQRAHQVKENALRQKNKLAQEIEAERAKMSAMLLAMKEVNTQKFNAERRRLNMVRMKNKLAKERDEERARLRELHDTIEEMKKEKEDAVKQKYKALKQRDEARTTCRKLNGDLKELRESVESLNESGCYVLETTERLAVMENTRRSTVTNSKNSRSRFPGIDYKRPQRVLKSKVPRPGVAKTKHPAMLPKIHQTQGPASIVPPPGRGGFPTVRGGRPIHYDQWGGSTYSHDVTESDVRSVAEFYDWGFYDDDHLPQPDLTRSYIQYADLHATGHQRALVNRPSHAGQWKKYPTGETLATHSHLRPPTLSDNGFHSNADVNYEESDYTTSTTESGSQGNTVDRQVSAHLEGLSSDPRAHVTHGYHGNMVDRQVSAHLCQWGCRTDCDCATNNVGQSESMKLPMIKSGQLYRQPAINSSIVDPPPRMKFPEL